MQRSKGDDLRAEKRAMAEEWSHFLIYRDEQFELAEGEQTLGRSRTCNFSVADPSVSRKHIILVAGPGHILVKDLGSSNGTFINDQKVQGEGILENGDRLRVGDAELSAAVRVKEDPNSFQTMRMAATGPEVATPPVAAPVSEPPAAASPATPAAAPVVEAPVAAPPAAASPAEPHQPGEATFFLAKESMKLAEALESVQDGPMSDPVADPATVPPKSFAQPPEAGLQTQRMEAVEPVGMATTAMTPEQLAELQPPQETEPSQAPGMATMAMTAEQIQQLGSAPEATGMATTAMTPEQLDSLRAEIAEAPSPTDVRPVAGGPTMALTAEQIEEARAFVPMPEEPATPPAPAVPEMPVVPQPVGDNTAIEVSFANLDDAESAVGISESGTAIPAPNFADLAPTPEPSASFAAESFAPAESPVSVEPPVPVAPVEPPVPIAPVEPPVPVAPVEPPVPAVAAPAPILEPPVVAPPAELANSLVAAPNVEPEPTPATPTSFDQPTPPAAAPVSFDQPTPPASFDQPTPPAAVPETSGEAAEGSEEPAFSLRQPSSAGALLPSLEEIDAAIGGPEMQPPDMDASVSIPAAEAVGGQNAGFGIRLLAGLLDALWAVALGVASIGPAKTLTADPMSLLPAVGALVGLIVFIGWSYFGTTPGKRVLGLYIHGGDGQAGIGFICAILRMVGYLFGLVGFPMIAFRQDRRGLHDLLAGTNVLRHD